MLWILFLALVFAVFVAAVWRMSAGPTNEEPYIGHNLPGASTTLPQVGPFPLSAGPELGTPESLVSGDPDRDLERLVERERHHRRYQPPEE